MKALKIIGIVAGIGVVLVGGVLVLAFSSSFQTWAVRKAVAGQPGMTLDVASVSAGLSSAELGEFRFVQDGVIVTSKGVSARYSAWDYLLGKGVNADDVTARDLVIDLRNPTPAAAPTAAVPAPAATVAAPFAGLLNAAQLPLPVRVGKLLAQGRALLPGNQTVVFELKGADIETGGNGKLEWAVDFADATAGAPLRALRTTGTAGVRISAGGRIDLAEIDSITAAMGPNLPSDRIALKARAEQPAGSADETYAFSVSLLRGTTSETLLESAARFAAASGEIAGTWKLATRSEQLAALLSGLGLPELVANGSGRFTAKPATRAVTASGELRAEASQLGRLVPALATIGSMRAVLAFDGGLAGDVAQLNTFSLDLTGADGTRVAQIVSAQKISYDAAAKRITFAQPGAALARVAVQALPLAWAQAFVAPLTIAGGDLSLTLALEAEPDGSRVRVRSVEPLALRGVTLRQDGKTLVENLTLLARPQLDYTPTRVVAEIAEIALTLPAGDTLGGKLTADITDLAKTPAIAFTAALQGKIIAALKPYLPLDPGALGFSTALSGRLQGDALELATASVSVTRADGAKLIAVETLQALRGDLKTSAFTAARPDAAAARLVLGEIPLAWAESFVAQSKFAGAVAGGTFEVALRSADEIAVTMPAPLQVRGAGVTLDGKALAQGVDLTATLTATKRGTTLAYDVTRLEVKQGATVLAGLSAAGSVPLGTKAALTAKGSLDANLVALTAQPALAAYATLASGRLAATFDATVGDTIQAKATVDARDLVAKQDRRALGDLQLALTAAMKEDGSGSVSLPLTLTNTARKSDLQIDATFGKAADKKTFVFAGKIASAQLFTDDFEPLAGLAPADEPAKPAAAPAPRPVVTAPTAPKRDTAPFWQGVNGKLDLNLKRVVYGKDYIIGDVRGAAVITDSRLALEGLTGRFKENPFKVAGGITFAAKDAKPYALTADVDVQNLDIGEILRAANPEEKPALETKATVTAKLAGNGATVADLAKNAFGKFELNGTQGTMRYLARKGQAGALVNIASFGLAVLGAAKGSDTTVAIAELARALNEVPFDSVKLQVERGADLQFKLTSMEVISPLLRLTGSGSVASRDIETVQNAPMNVLLQLGAKGELGFLLQRVGLLGANQDDKGYQLMSRTFAIGGTPAKPDNTVLWKMLGEAALGALAR